MALKVKINSITVPNINITIQSKYPDFTTTIDCTNLIDLSNVEKFPKDLKKVAKDYVKGQEDNEIKAIVVDPAVTALIGTTIDLSII